MESIGVVVFSKAFSSCFQETSLSGYINMHSQIWKIGCQWNLAQFKDFWNYSLMSDLDDRSCRLPVELLNFSWEDRMVDISFLFCDWAFVTGK